MKTAAIYARVSSDKQREENTIASQTSALIAFAREQNCDVPAEWVIEDDGYSGASLLRPGLERLRDLAAEGLIQVGLVYAPDRLSRRYAHQILLIEEFARAGVEILFIRSKRAATPEDELHGKQIANTVNKAMDALPEELRTAITLREIEGLSYDEIANVMNCPIGTVRSRIFRAREAIAAELRPLLGTDKDRRW